MSLTELPENLPIPENDGAADHLLGMSLPEITLKGTDGAEHNLAQLDQWTVIYIYPMTGRPDTPLPDNWDEIPGARGCTPQSCAFGDHYAELQALNSAVFGLSSQSTDYQLEAQQRLHLPFALLSDDSLQLKHQLKLPTFVVEGRELYRRLTLVVQGREIKKVFYPVFPPSENAADVMAWLRSSAVS